MPIICGVLTLVVDLVLLGMESLLGICVFIVFLFIMTISIVVFGLGWVLIYHELKKKWAITMLDIALIAVLLIEILYIGGNL